MKKLLLTLFILGLGLTVKAEDGHQLWLRYAPVNSCRAI